MATIGTFTRTNGSFTGAVKTLSINAKTTIKPADKANDRAPDYRILTSAAVEFGAAWKKTSGEGREYLSVKLDDPSFPAPISRCRATIPPSHSLEVHCSTQTCGERAECPLNGEHVSDRFQTFGRLYTPRNPTKLKQTAL